MHPGIKLKEYIDRKGLNHTQLMVESGIPRSTWYELLSGNRSISFSTCKKLEKITPGMTAKSWAYAQFSHDWEEFNK